MSEDLRTQQKQLIAGVAILAILFIIVITALIRSAQHRDPRQSIGHRVPAARLAYCSPGDTGLCIVSFGQMVDGDMLVNIQTPRFLYPEFILVINRYGVESAYQCQKVKGLTTGVSCTGASQSPGEVLQFKAISRKDGTLLAEGKFSIIGIALATPEGFGTETPEISITETLATETPTPTAIPLLPTMTKTTPTPLPTFPSYPNPTTYP